jgi:hypothetical protein
MQDGIRKFLTPGDDGASVGLWLGGGRALVGRCVRQALRCLFRPTVAASLPTLPGPLFLLHFRSLFHHPQGDGRPLIVGQVAAGGMQGRRPMVSVLPIPLLHLARAGGIQAREPDIIQGSRTSPSAARPRPSPAARLRRLAARGRTGPGGSSRGRPPVMTDRGGFLRIRTREHPGRGIVTAAPGSAPDGAAPAARGPGGMTPGSSTPDAPRPAPPGPGGTWVASSSPPGTSSPPSPRTPGRPAA